ncbi:hypothetical protein GCM10007049_35400 [Echinicola pacifica]|uniref:DUF4221 domain-containing protein n=1 Tax=Echinicola pacifica TaxID=346377 RepID=A0A918QA86_9BACT|nr:DUF4221 family protein [Echinicola pacifica]GGZ39010.1 hypothetical protein GCM10007049_35400 [Echinicola pacifica]
MMRFLFLLILSISMSCQNRKGEVLYDDLSYLIDTVIINSKGRLLDLDLDILKSDLNEEKSSIFLYNKFDHSIDEINLDDLEVVSNYSFEAEGPNGTGEYIYDIYFLENASLFIKSSTGSSVFNINGELLEKIDWVNALGLDSLAYGQIPTYEVAIGSSDLKVFGLTYDQSNSSVYFDVLSVQDNSVARYDIDTEKSYHDFVLKIDDPYSFLDPRVYNMSENDYIIVSHQFSSEIYLFNSAGKPVRTINYSPKLTSSRVRDFNFKSLSTYGQLQDEYQKLLEQVRFGPLVWDDVKKRYFRLSATRIFSNIRKEEDAFLPEIKETKVFLSVFDADFNLISELNVPELRSENVKYFAKDGKLWVFQNLLDELGFIVLDI